jgi:hypothetical protein
MRACAIGYAFAIAQSTAVSVVLSQSPTYPELYDTFAKAYVLTMQSCSALNRTTRVRLSASGVVTAKVFHQRCILPPWRSSMKSDEFVELCLADERLLELLSKAQINNLTTLIVLARNARIVGVADDLKQFHMTQPERAHLIADVLAGLTKSDTLDKLDADQLTFLREQINSRVIPWMDKRTKLEWRWINKLIS